LLSNFNPFSATGKFGIVTATRLLVPKAQTGETATKAVVKATAAIHFFKQFIFLFTFSHRVHFLVRHFDKTHNLIRPRVTDGSESE
jgi:hypothetical protein